ncbi:MAG: tRNA (N6-isopentenyl adenosine(37)-C2)-methylthiotransferase MiaB [Deltaproteobacteria bacterium]|nr:tRNA (N6-isopentenyl adenosine(37)-C2)-methylthiotransferase MiaB [Deltaproteobacteria bacterium]
MTPAPENEDHLESTHRDYYVDPAEIHFVRFVTEAWDGVAFMSTLDERAGLIRLSVPPGREGEADEMMDALGRDVSLSPAEKGCGRKLAHIKTMGCQMNVYESLQMMRSLEPLGYVETGSVKNADLIVVNTCAVREKAQQKVVSFLGRLRKQKAENPGLIIAVGGCVAQSMGEILIEKMPFVDIVFGTHAVGRLGGYVEEARTLGRKVVDVTLSGRYDFSGAGRLPSKREASSPTAFVTIIQGCDNFCSYCVVPHVRGRETSRPPAEVLSEVAALAGRGVKEVTLLGQNVNSYGKKENTEGFAELLYRVSEIEGIERIRFTTSHPKDLSDDLVRAFGEIKKLCGHLHLPVQSGSNRILKKMNRGYTREDYLSKVEKLRRARPDICLTSDFIVGFPTETEDEFEESLSLIREVAFSGLFAFNYSDRPPAAAVKFSGKVAPEIQSERLSRLLAVNDELSRAAYESLVGKTVEVLVEGRSKSDRMQLTGRTGCHKIVNFPLPPSTGRAARNWEGEMATVTIERSLAHSLLGRMIPDESRPTDQ